MSDFSAAVTVDTRDAINSSWNLRIASEVFESDLNNLLAATARDGSTKRIRGLSETPGFLCGIGFNREAFMEFIAESDGEDVTIRMVLGLRVNNGLRRSVGIGVVIGLQRMIAMSARRRVCAIRSSISVKEWFLDEGGDVVEDSSVIWIGKGNC